MASSLLDNPLLQDFTFPAYDTIQPNHVIPAMEHLLRNLENELNELQNGIEPTWPKLVVPLEKITDRLNIVWGIVNHLSAVKDSPQLRAAIQQIQPKVVEFQLKVKQSKSIYEAFKAITESSDWESLNQARKRIVEINLKQAILNGVSLDETRRKQFNEIEQETAKLAVRFEENLLDAINEFQKVIQDKSEIDGLPPTTLAIAAETAIHKGYKNATAENGPWIITLDGPMYRSVLQHCRNRSLREELFRAYVTRASNGSLNNTPIIERMLELRLEKAKLLGFSNYAEVSMEMKMATIDKAKELIEKLYNAAWDPALQELEDIRDFARVHGAVEVDDLNHWDINFWSERLRESKYDINEEELRPNFSLPKVMEGLFSFTKKLFDVDIEQADGIAPVWDQSVSFYKVKDSSGITIAYFYFDPYSRPSEKRGGAWKETVVNRSITVSKDNTHPRLPIAVIVCNQSPPTKEKPSLMTIKEVETVFHEFGHALQHMLTKQDEGLVSGSQGIEWDAVEIPSLFMENWCYQRDTILSLAKHYVTGETLSDDTISKIVSARTFRAGSLLLRQLRYAGVDLELYTNYVAGGPKSVHDIDQEIGRKTQPIPLLPEDRFLCSFSHIFADSYAAGYYSYQWAEVLSADAFSAFEEAGLDNDKSLKELGQRFRETILALGGGKSPNEVFLDFRGHEPTPDAFLRHNGLLPTVST